MIIRLFVVFVVIMAGFLAAQVYSLYSARAYIQDIPEGHYIGPENADLLVVEFLDYSCPFCQEIHPTIMEAVKTDGNVKYAPLPIKSSNGDGTAAAYLLYAAGKMGKFEYAHNYLIENGTNLSQERLPEIAGDLGLDADEFITHVKSNDVFKQVTANHKAHGNLRNGVTPTFFIGPNIRYIPEVQMPSVDDFLKMFAEARNSN